MKKLLFLLPLFLWGQETETVRETTIYSSPKGSSETALGELNEGTKITKLKKDRSGEFIKSTIEFYIPVKALADGRVSLPVGVDQVADNANYRLIKAKKNGKQIQVSLKVSNTHKTRSLDFSAMALIKAIGKDENNGELNPFKGKHQGLAIIEPNNSLVAELVYDFKKTPQNVELICTGKLNGESVIYHLGF